MAGRTETLLTVDETAKRLVFSSGHVRRLVASGALPHVRLGVRAIRIAEADLEAFVRSRRRSSTGV